MSCSSTSTSSNTPGFPTASQMQQTASNQGIISSEIAAIQQAILAAASQCQPGGGKMCTTISTGTPMTSVAGIASVTVVNGGDGYMTDTPTIQIIPPQGATGATLATGTLTTNGGIVTGITITSPGAGYQPIPSTLSVTSLAGTGAVLTPYVNANGAIISINIVSSGLNYKVNDVISATRAVTPVISTTTSTSTTTLSNGFPCECRCGRWEDYRMYDSGSGTNQSKGWWNSNGIYVQAYYDQYHNHNQRYGREYNCYGCDCGTNSHNTTAPVIDAVMVVTAVSSTGAILATSILNGGTWYQPATASVRIVSTLSPSTGYPVGTGFLGGVTVDSSGYVIGAYINNGGAGYVTLYPTLTINDSGTGAVTSVSIINGAVTSISVTSSGSNYTTSATGIVKNPITAPLPNPPVNPAIVNINVNANTYGTVPNQYWQVFQGTSTSCALSDQMNSVISYFKNLGYSITQQTNPITGNTIQWYICWC